VIINVKPDPEDLPTTHPQWNAPPSLTREGLALRSDDTEAKLCNELKIESREVKKELSHLVRPKKTEAQRKAPRSISNKVKIL